VVIVIQYLLLNVLLILVGLFIQHIWTEKKQISYHDKTINAVVYSLLIVLSISFSIQHFSDFIGDFTHIPLIIGSFYGGVVVSVILFLVLTTYHILVNGIMPCCFPTVIMLYGVLTLFVSLILSKYIGNKSYQIKTRTLSFVAFTFSTLYLFVIQATHQNIVSLDLVLSFIVVPSCLIFIVIYIVEFLKNNIKLRKQIIKSEKAEVVSQLAASVSHEVRNPLTVTRGFLQLVMESDDNSLETNRQFLKMAIEELDAASSIINDYLTFAKPSPEKWERMDIDIQIRRIVDIITSYANMNSVEIKMDLVSCMIQGNKQQFHQCLLNIIKNSIEAMPEGGVLIIANTIEKRDVIINISDTGVGMTQEQLERIGEPYFSTKEKGTGLGMMVATSIIKSMRGTISIQSKGGEGTIISIQLPIDE
jgi:two-component system, sporulation sensor kinase B